MLLAEVCNCLVLGLITFSDIDAAMASMVLLVEVKADFAVGEGDGLDKTVMVSGLREKKG
jgi:hypothetical protein